MSDDLHTRLGIGGNDPPEPIDPGAWLRDTDPTKLVKIDPERLAELLAFQYRGLLERNGDLFDRAYVEAHTEITSDAETNAASALYKQLGDHAGRRSVDRAGKI